MQGDLNGRTALVTGAGRNIGRAIALALAGAGCNLVLNGSRDRAALEAVAREAETLGVHAMTALADVGDATAVACMVAQAAARFGAVHIAISNVGRRAVRPLLEITPEEWDSTLRTNLSACFYLARAVLPGMQGAGFGRIIHISGRDGFWTRESRAHNVTAKAGMHSLAKAIALEFGPHGVTANTVAPGLIDTIRDPHTHPGMAAEAALRVPRIPARRMGTVADIAETCLWLCSPKAGFITGQLVHVNGGEFLA
jgi:3-oxoacyl-[acyl-carrier protein] reductase